MHKDKAREGAERLRQAILKKAFSGRLVKKKNDKVAVILSKEINLTLPSR